MPVIPEYMDNDNAKFSKTRTWSPDDSAYEFALCELRSRYENVYRKFKPLTTDEAFECVDKDRSSGLIYESMGVRTKGQLIAKYGPMLRQSIEDIMDGKYRGTKFKEAPKVEIRPIEKLLHEDVSKRKQRTFMVSDTLHYLVGCIIYKNFNDAINDMCYNNDNWSYVGATNFYGGANAFVDYMTKSGTDKTNNFDASAMEACINAKILEMIYDMKHQAITDVRYQNLARWYVSHLLSGMVVMHDGRVCIKDGMNPSGQLNTLIDNIHAMEFVLLYCIAKRHNQISLPVFKAFSAFTRSLSCKIMGDDVCADSDECWDYVIPYSKDLGFSIDYEYPRHSPISKIRFCGSGFVYDRDHLMWASVPNVDKLKASLFFHMKEHSWRKAYSKLCAMKILFYPLKKEYNEVCDMLEYVETQHKSKILAEKHLDDVLPLQSLFSQKLSDREIAHLHFG